MLWAGTGTADFIFQDYVDQGEKHDSRTLGFPDISIRNETGRDTLPITPPPPKEVEGCEDKRQKRKQEDPETAAGNETGKGTVGTTRELATEGGTDVKDQRPSGNESERTHLQNTKSEEDTADKAEAEYRHSAGKENEVGDREKSRKDPETSGQQEHLDTWKDKKMIDVERCQIIWIPDALVISVIVGTLAVCFGSSYWFRRKHCRQGNERAEGENDSPSGQEVRQPNITDTRRPQTSLSKKRGRFASNKSARETSGETVRTAIEHKTIKTEERPRGTNSEGCKLLSKQSEESFADKGKTSPTQDKHGVDIKEHPSNESDRSKLQNREIENTVNDAKKGPAENEHYAENEELILQYRYYLRVQSRNVKMPKLRLISDIYTNPRITVTHTEYEDATGGSHNHVREVEIHELLKRSSSDSDKTTISVVYGGCRIWGKTTLIQKIVHDWATGIKYVHFRFVLYFKIQNLNAIEGRITLSRLIVDAYPYLENANHSVTQLNLSNSSQDEKQVNQFTHGRLQHHVGKLRSAETNQEEEEEEEAWPAQPTPSAPRYTPPKRSPQGDPNSPPKNAVATCTRGQLRQRTFNNQPGTRKPRRWRNFLEGGG
ncbi:uncharacterized protein [Hemitrygon akajei]|uniref:uncharacterized protein n=1 Tax=Hemitrygon akajei TaxID=2704970 RepID=UPI003BF99FBF